MPVCLGEASVRGLQAWRSGKQRKVCHPVSNNRGDAETRRKASHFQPESDDPQLVGAVPVQDAHPSLLSQ